MFSWFVGRSAYMFLGGHYADLFLIQNWFVKIDRELIVFYRGFVNVDKSKLRFTKAKRYLFLTI